jgi:hypothetical protein
MNTINQGSVTERTLTQKLVETGHLNVLERKQLPNGRVRAGVIFYIVEELLKEHGWFPQNLRPSDIYDGGLLEMQTNGLCRIHWKHEVGLLRYETTEVQSFNSAKQAIQIYISRSWPNGIDGVAINWGHKNWKTLLKTFNFLKWISK